MNETKTIFVNEYHFDDIEKEHQRVQEMLSNTLLKKFKSECNHNTFDYAEDVLHDYVYVPSNVAMWVGRYCRYIDMTSPLTMKLKLGGYIVNDNRYTVTLLTHKKRIYNVSKRCKLWFMLPTCNDINRIKLNNLL